jgi:dihydroneopterin aldolase
MADIGINPDEFGRRQPLAIQAELKVRQVAADRIESTFDYREIVRHAEALAEERIALIETFARRLAEACLQDPSVMMAEIVIDKPAALPNGLAGVRVVLERQ